MTEGYSQFRHSNDNEPLVHPAPLKFPDRFTPVMVPLIPKTTLTLYGGGSGLDHSHIRRHRPEGGLTVSKKSVQTWIADNAINLI